MSVVRCGSASGSDVRCGSDIRCGSAGVRIGRATGRLVVAALTTLALAPPLVAVVREPTPAIVVDGSDWVWARVPDAAPVEAYHNAGYRLRIEQGAVVIDVDAYPLASAAPFVLPSLTGGQGGDSLVQTARSVVAGAHRRYDAVSRILGWVAANIEYNLDRSAPQDAAAVLARRAGYCTGAARLTVALLGAVGITAREVPGFVLGEGGGGYHRWVEVYYPDRGWSFSDPQRYHHYVPATYVRLAAETLGEGDLLSASLLRREDSRRPVDLYQAAPVGVSARRNDDRQLAGTLRVVVAGSARGTAILEGHGERQVRVLAAGEANFVGIEPGSYLLEVLAEDQPPRRKQIVFRDRVVGVVHIAESS